jgi:hypothetical protein
MDHRIQQLGTASGLTTLFLQYFNDWQKFESLSKQTREDLADAEVEPIAPPLDNYCSNLVTKLKKPVVVKPR